MIGGGVFDGDVFGVVGCGDFAGGVGVDLVGETEVVLAGDTEVVLAGETDVVLVGEIEVVLACEIEVVLAGETEVFLVGGRSMDVPGSGLCGGDGVIFWREKTASGDGDVRLDDCRGTIYISFYFSKLRL